MPFNAAVAIPGFRGLANALDTAELTFEHLQHATNFYLDGNRWPHLRRGYVDVAAAQALHISRYKNKGYFIASSDTGHIITSDGYTLLTSDGQYLVPADASANVTNNLYDVESGVLLQEDVGDGPYYFTDAGLRTYFLGNSDSYYIDSGHVYRWGLEVPPRPLVTHMPGGELYKGAYRITLAYQSLLTGMVSGTLAPITINVLDGDRLIINDLPQKAGHAVIILVSKTDGSVMYEYARTTQPSIIIERIDADVSRIYTLINRYPPPLGGPICYHNGRIYVAVYDAQSDFTSIFGSERNAYGFFNLTGDADYDQMGRVNCLVSLPHGMLIGTGFEIIYMANDGERRVLAQYGTVAGNNFDYDDEGRAYVVTKQGIRRVGGEPLFEDVNEGRFITNWGETCGSGFLRHDGTPLFVTSIFHENEVTDAAGFQKSWL